MLKFKIDIYIKLILIISIISLVTAFFIEYILGHQPCNLCLIERIPYALSAFIICLWYITEINKHFLVILLILTFVFSLVISFYHFGIEQGFFEESVVCGAKNALNAITKDELLRELSEKTISCKDVTFRIFGLSLTSINILLNLFIIFILTHNFFFYDEK
tara:strand:+ start:89 stop:571 length:483 start_codon:yes stop_codon:yes gene_type:complete